LEKENITIKVKNDIKFKAQRLIAVFSLLIFAGKLLAYFLTNSVGILTDALESTVNVVTGFISLYSIYIALKPKDENHPFGHGKAEFLSASMEGLLIMFAGFFILYEAIRRLFEPADVTQLDVGIYIIAIAGLLNYIVGWNSVRIGKNNNSMALISGGKHLISDTYSSIGLVIGLVLLYYTNLAWLDSVIALVFGTIIIITGYKILKETTSHLMDEADFKLIEDFGQTIEKNRNDVWIDIHNFRLVKYGDSYHINCDLVLPWNMLLTDAHNEGEKFKSLLSKQYSEEIILNLHLDECHFSYCKHCKNSNCNERKEEFVKLINFDINNFINEKNEKSEIQKI
jgi:cation diffusion facilitator family transporter